MTVRDFDGATAGFTTPIALNGLTTNQFPISRITGMLFWNGRLVYATTGTLSAVDFTAGVPTGSVTVLGGPAVDGQSWQFRGLFVL
jgi:hypothetical protein